MTRLEIGFVVVAGVWAGLILGVSFVATPAKFLASSITLPIALDVGRSTFRVSLLIELCFASALVASGAIAFGWGGKTLVAVGILAALAVQRFVLLPSLDARTTLVIAGAQLPPSWHHLVWIAADALRFLMLLGLCVVALGDSRAFSEVTVRQSAHAFIVNFEPQQENEHARERDLQDERNSHRWPRWRCSLR